MTPQRPMLFRNLKTGMVLFFFMLVALLGCSDSQESEETPVSESTQVVTESVPTTAATVEPVADPVSPIQNSSIAQSPVATPAPTPIIAKEEATARVPDTVKTDEITSQKPAEGTGLIVGRLVNIDNGLSASYAWVYLAPALGPDAKPMVALDRATAPLSISSQNGVFYFEDVEPGRYGLVIWGPVGSVLVNETGTEYSLLFTVESDQVMDLGDVISFIP